MPALKDLQASSAQTLEQLRTNRPSTRRRRHDKRSKLMKYRVELVGLRQAGASYRELVYWLGKAHKCKIDHTTVRRYLVKLPELQSQGDDNANLS